MSENRTWFRNSLGLCLRFSEVHLVWIADQILGFGFRPGFKRTGVHAVSFWGSVSDSGSLCSPGFGPVLDLPGSGWSWNCAVVCSRRETADLFFNVHWAGLFTRGESRVGLSLLIIQSQRGRVTALIVIGQLCAAAPPTFAVRIRGAVFFCHIISL